MQPDSILQLNLKSKLDLIKEFQLLVNSNEVQIPVLYNCFNDIQARWKAIGEVPQEEEKRLSQSYQSLIYQWFDKVKLITKQREEELQSKKKQELEEKEFLCEEAERIIYCTSFQKSVEKLKDLRERWEMINSSSVQCDEWTKHYKLTKELSDRFHYAISNIENRHCEYLKHRNCFSIKKVDQNNISHTPEKKETSVNIHSDENIYTLGVNSLVVPYLSVKPLETGVYDIINKKKYKSPFAWNNVIINSIVIEQFIDKKCGFELKKEKPAVERIEIPNPTVYKIDISIIPSLNKNYITKHTFLCTNGLYFFLNSILRTINYLLAQGYSVYDINFNFLEEQCRKKGKLTGNSRIGEYIMPNECTPRGFFRLINEMVIEVFEYGHGGRNGSFYGKEIEMVIKTSDIFINSVLSDYLHAQPVISESTNTSKYAFSIKEHCDDTPYEDYIFKVKPNEKDQIKKDLAERIITDCISKVDIETAIIYHSLIHN